MPHLLWHDIGTPPLNLEKKITLYTISLDDIVYRVFFPSNLEGECLCETGPWFTQSHQKTARCHPNLSPLMSSHGYWGPILLRIMALLLILECVAINIQQYTYTVTHVSFLMIDKANVRIARMSDYTCVLFVLGFSFHWRIFYSNGDVTITGEGLQPSKFNLYSVLIFMHSVVRVFCVPHLLRHGAFIWSS